MKTTILSLAAVLLLSASSYAQNVPSYVPTSGLVGWWPFNGNANDESGNGNNGVVNGATLTSDRFGTANAAFLFSSNSTDNIELQGLSVTNDWTITQWFLPSGNNISSQNYLMGLKCQLYWAGIGQAHSAPSCGLPTNSSFIFDGIQGCSNLLSTVQNFNLNSYNFLSVTYLNGTYSISLNGQTTSTSSSLIDLDLVDIMIGRRCNDPAAYTFSGHIDDIGIWNRVLTPQEISSLYSVCSNSITSQPSSQTVNITTNAQFTAVSSDPSATFQWQSDLGFGFQNLTNAGQYSGTNTNTLQVSSVTLANNNQSFRCIVTYGGCSDTSNTAVLTVNNNTGLNELSSSAAFTIYPNPAADIISIKADASLMGKNYILYDAVGRVVCSGTVASSTMSVSLNGLSSGLYTLVINKQYRKSFTVAK